MFFYKTIPLTIAWTALLPYVLIVLILTLFVISIALYIEF